MKFFWTLLDTNNTDMFWTSFPDILEEWHAKDSKDKHDQEEKKTDIEQGRHGHDQREQKSSDTFSTFDQTQHTTNLFFLRMCVVIFLHIFFQTFSLHFLD